MNYNQIADAALGYADRLDDPMLQIPDVNTINTRDRWAINRMIEMVESRINRRLQTRDMGVRAYITTNKDLEYYGLPPDYAGLRDIEIRSTMDSTVRPTLAFVTPEYMSKMISENSPQFFYTIINRQIQIHPRMDGYILEILYYRRIPALTVDATTNWVSEKYPDVYVQGLLVEISSYAKDVEAVQLWETRFNASVEEMIQEDAIDRWSGPTPVVRLM